eukprot:CAMPEP_0194048924 /NCGR_PEP_ID=MMETSP0009_2-20130614/29013_1 /TAXON_ID=210454 /ORGANISM="Grammatophora oceanica, Strain CCMP 410" /LENGTH=256 /DNA_ID=CAMNT_0038694953 /DNA_START=130 /DNA_END=897 /DNA_ORIENTATION=+
MAVMVADPYKALGLPHQATQPQIKVAYRKLAKKYHPDRLTRINASPSERTVAADKFAAVSAAYQLLSDERRKREYDHIYKFGGYDDHGGEANPQTPPRAGRRAADPADPFPPPSSTTGSKRARSTGIGYAVSDPVSYIFSQGKNQSKTVAGIQIPSRMHLAHPPPGGGLRFAFSSGECKTENNGSRKFVSKTTQFVQGKKYTRVETTTLHPDGRKEVIIEGNDYVERKVTNTPRKIKRKVNAEDEMTHAAQEELPW